MEGAWLLLVMELTHKAGHVMQIPVMPRLRFLPWIIWGREINIWISVWSSFLNLDLGLSSSLVKDTLVQSNGSVTSAENLDEDAVGTGGPLTSKLGHFEQTGTLMELFSTNAKYRVSYLGKVMQCETELKDFDLFL